jgi:hypothetical protein
MADGVALIQATVETLAAEDIVGQCLGEELVTLYSAIEQLQAQVSRRLAVFDGRGDAKADGFGSTASWLAAKCRKDPGDAHRAVRVARLERYLPEITDLWEAGGTTTSHVQQVARVRHKAKADELFDALRGTWHRLCAKEDVATLNKAFVAFLERLDNTKPIDEQAKLRAIDRRRLAGSLCLGVGNIEGRYDLESYELIMLAIEHERHAGHAEGDQRTIEQARADALTEICRRTLNGRNDGGDTEPHINVIVTQETLAGLDAGLCETDTGLAMSVDTVRRLCCHSTIGRILIDQFGAVLDLGHGQRIFNRAQRRAMAYRDRGCCFPGCTRPARHCQTHHLTWWEHGGRTNLDNGALLCWAHHRFVHELGWRVTRNTTGGLDWHKPDGTHHATWHPPDLPEPLPMSSKTSRAVKRGCTSRAGPGPER